MSHKKTRILLGMSGGVDSSVSAKLLKQAGYDVIGIFMKNWEDDNIACTAEADYYDVERVCYHLDIPYYPINLTKQYYEGVFSKFLQELKKGYTPNPDILCNKVIKFGAFREETANLAAETIATGHYAQWIEHEKYGRSLHKGFDLNKDQTYFLALVPLERLEKTIFPIGHLTKPKVREIAKEIGLINADKKDSVGICFIGKRSFTKFIQKHLSTPKGEIRCLDTDILLGEHNGIILATLGQRKGLNIGGKVNKKGPWYVANKDVASNTIYVVEGKNHPALFTKEVKVKNMNWLVRTPLAKNFHCTAKCRYRQTAAPCDVEIISSNRLKITFKEAQWAVTIGQALVLYDENVCLGGGIITK